MIENILIFAGIVALAAIAINRTRKVSELERLLETRSIEGEYDQVDATRYRWLRSRSTRAEQQEAEIDAAIEREKSDHGQNR